MSDRPEDRTETEALTALTAELATRLEGPEGNRVMATIQSATALHRAIHAASKGLDDEEYEAFWERVGWGRIDDLEAVLVEWEGRWRE